MRQLIGAAPPPSGRPLSHEARLFNFLAFTASRFRSSRVPPFRSNFLARHIKAIGPADPRLVVWAPKRGQLLSLYFHSVSRSTHSTLPAFQKFFCQNILTAVLLRPRRRRFSARAAREGRPRQRIKLSLFTAP